VRTIGDYPVLNARHKLAQTVANELLPAERDVDEAILRSSRLAIAVVEGRRTLKVALTAGQQGLELVTQATASLVHARGLLAEAHVAFRQTQSEIGLDAFSYGDMGECPPAKGELKIVEAA